MPAATWRIEHGQPAALRTCVLGGGADRRRRWLRRRCGFCHGSRPAAVLGVHRAVRDLADCRVDATRLSWLALPQPRKTLAANPEDAGEISEQERPARPAALSNNAALALLASRGAPGRQLARRSLECEKPCCLRLGARSF